MYSSQNRVARYYNTNAARRSELDELVHVRDARGSCEKLARSGAPDHSVACNDGLLVSGDVRHRHDREGRITGGGRIVKSKAYAGSQDGRGLDSVSLDSAGGNRTRVDYIRRVGEAQHVWIISSELRSKEGSTDICECRLVIDRRPGG